MEESRRLLKVMKFGGSSVGSVERMRQVVKIVQASSSSRRLVVVASALSGVTRRLVIAFEKLRSGASDGHRVLHFLQERHQELAAALLRPETFARYEAVLTDHLEQLARIFAQDRVEKASPAIHDEVLATGERLSIPLFALALRDAGLDAGAVDASDLLQTDAAHGAASVALETSARRVRAWYEALPEGRVPVVTGFIGATAEGATTTLGFEGSDYSAALFAAFLDAEVLERWTDTDGLYTADPGEDLEAQRHDRLVMEDALARNEAGRLGMHPKTLHPLLEAGVPIHVRCVTTPEKAGTRVVPLAVSDPPSVNGKQKRAWKRSFSRGSKMEDRG